MNRVYQLNYLTQEFYNKYSSADYPEIECKTTRPYMVLLIKIDNNNFAIPFRTNIRHKYCYKFKNSDRDSSSVTGLDYTKAVIVNDNSFIGDEATIDNKEYVELNNKYYFIISQFKKYISGYSEFIKGNLNEFESRKYQYSTLKYFHDELNIK